MTERFEVRYGMAVLRPEPVRLVCAPDPEPILWPIVRAGVAIAAVLAVCVGAALMHLPPALGFLVGLIAGWLAVRCFGHGEAGRMRPSGEGRSINARAVRIVRGGREGVGGYVGASRHKRPSARL